MYGFLGYYWTTSGYLNGGGINETFSNPDCSFGNLNRIKRINLLTVQKEVMGE